MVKTKDGTYVDREDFVGEFMFQDEDDEEYAEYMKKMK